MSDKQGPNPAIMAGLAAGVVAVVAILESISGESITEAFRGGVVAAAARDFGDLLVAVIQREFDNLNQRRNVRRLEASLAESERAVQGIDHARIGQCLL